MQQRIRWRHLPQDRFEIAGVDVFPLLAPVEPHHHHGRLAGSRQCRRRCWIGSIGVADQQIGVSSSQPLQRGNHHAGLGAGVGGAAIAEVGRGGQSADHRQRAQSAQGQDRALVPEQHDRLGGRLPGQGDVGRAAPQRSRIAAGRQAQLGSQLPQHRVIDPLHRQASSGQGLLQAAREDHRKGHLQVEPRIEGLDAVAQAEDEIADHEAAEAPALLEDRGEQFPMLAAPVAIHLVVGAHHRTGSRLDAVAEMGQVKLLQHPATHLHIHQEAGAVDRVEGEMLDAGDRVALQAPGHGGAQASEQHGVFAVGLLGPAPAGVPQQVDADSRHPVGAETAGLQGDRFADALLEFVIPAGTAGDRHREGGGAPLEHHPAGTIDELQAAEPEARHRPSRPGMAVGGVMESDVGHARPEGSISLEQGQLLGCAEGGQQRLGPIGAVGARYGIARRPSRGLGGVGRGWSGGDRGPWSLWPGAAGDGPEGLGEPATSRRPPWLAGSPLPLDQGRSIAAVQLTGQMLVQKVRACSPINWAAKSSLKEACNCQARSRLLAAERSSSMSSQASMARPWDSMANSRLREKGFMVARICSQDVTKLPSVAWFGCWVRSRCWAGLGWSGLVPGGSVPRIPRHPPKAPKGPRMVLNNGGLSLHARDRVLRSQRPARPDRSNR